MNCFETLNIRIVEHFHSISATITAIISSSANRLYYSKIYIFNFKAGALLIRFPIKKLANLFYEIMIIGWTLFEPFSLSLSPSRRESGLKNQYNAHSSHCSSLFYQLSIWVCIFNEFEKSSGAQQPGQAGRKTKKKKEKSTHIRVRVQ